MHLSQQVFFSFLLKANKNVQAIMKFLTTRRTSSLFSHSHASVDPSATLKLALCDEHVHRQNVAPSSIQSSRTSATIFRKCCLPNERLSIEGTHDNGRIDYVCSGIPTDASKTLKLLR